MDVLASAVGLLFLLPLFALVALLITIDSPGPVFFRQRRVGKDGRTFIIFKFRSMDEATLTLPPGITVSGDKRITRVGGFLRRYKIDELPQLWNVLVGEMSLVGPRPELPKYVEAYSPRQLQVLSVSPGITDPASIAYRHEEELLSSAENPDAVYRWEILPDKLNRNSAYIQTISFSGDMAILLRTIFVSFLDFRYASTSANNHNRKNHPATADIVNRSSRSFR